MFKPLRGVIGSAALALLASSTSFAQELPAGSVPFNIESQLLPDALNAWAQQAGVQLVWRASEEGALQIAPRVVGAFTPGEALRSLLMGSGFTYSLVDGETVAIQPEKNASKVKRIAMTSDAGGEQQRTEAGADGRGGSGAGNSRAEAVALVADKKPTSVSSAGADDTLAEVVVTGSHIRGSVTAASVIDVTHEDIERSGFTSTAQVLNALPQNFSGGSAQVVAAQGAATSEFSIFIGTNTPSLRGLGDATLTLVDGHRLSRTGGTNGSDLASIPASAIERIEILPDGASAVYGADAVAGVINVILRKDFDGLEGSVGFSEPTRDGGGGQQTYSILGGTHWTSGNILVSYTRQNQNELFASDRSFSALAAEPSTLVPDTRSDAVTFYVNQSVSARTSVYASALYNRRTGLASLSYASPGFSFSQYMPGEGEQYTANTGLIFEPTANWVLGLDANMAQDKQDQQLLFAFPGSPPSVASISKPDNKAYSVEGHASGVLDSLPSGDIKGAFGVGARRETYDIAFPLSPSSAASGERDDTYAFAEVELPVVRADETRLGLTRLDLSVAGRVDHYSDFGTSANPKMGVIYGLTPDLRVRGSYATSFRTPLLQRVNGPATGSLFTANDPSFPGGTAVALYASGANSELNPEKSKSWTAAIDFAPKFIQGLSLSGTYFSYDFHDKILAPVTGDYQVLALSDPSILPFANLSASALEVQAFASGLVPPIRNFAGPGATLNDVQAILDNRFTNISVWTAHGVDVLGSYRLDMASSVLDLSLNASKLFVDAQPTPTAQRSALSGVVFGPPKLKIRGGAGWSTGRLSFGGSVNYLSDAKDVYSSAQAKVGSFTTLDLHVGYVFEPSSMSMLSGLRMGLTVLNALDRDPPRLATGSTTYPGIGYDSTNASPLGRVLTLQITKSWDPAAR